MERNERSVYTALGMESDLFINVTCVMFDALIPILWSRITAGIF